MDASFVPVIPELPARRRRRRRRGAGTGPNNSGVRRQDVIEVHHPVVAQVTPDVEIEEDNAVIPVMEFEVVDEEERAALYDTPLDFPIPFHTVEAEPHRPTHYAVAMPDTTMVITPAVPTTDRGDDAITMVPPPTTEWRKELSRLKMFRWLRKKAPQPPRKVSRLKLFVDYLVGHGQKHDIVVSEEKEIQDIADMGYMAKGHCVLQSIKHLDCFDPANELAIYNFIINFLQTEFPADIPRNKATEAEVRRKAKLFMEENDLPFNFVSDHLYYIANLMFLDQGGYRTTDVKLGFWKHIVCGNVDTSDDEEPSVAVRRARMRRMTRSEMVVSSRLN